MLNASADLASTPRPEPQPPTHPRQAWLDALAGISVAGVLLPEAVAYAAIAGVEPLHALIAALAGLLAYPWMGTSRFAIVAPTSAAAAVFASTSVQGGPAMGFALVVLTGGLLLAAGFLRAGFLGAFISRAVLRGFAWALALTIVVRQLPHLVGLSVHATLPGELLRQLLHQATHWHRPSMAIGAGALVMWLLLYRMAQRKAFIPVSLIVLVLGTLLSMLLDLEALGVATVSPIVWDMPSWSLPDLGTEQWLRAAEIAPALLLILFSESWGSVRSLALQEGDRVDANRELLALGACNLASGVLQGLPVGAGFSAAAANYRAGARSRLAGVMAALALMLLLWLARPWLTLMPVPVLAAVVTGILSHNLWPRPLLAGRRWGRDSWMAWVAALGVLLLGVLHGMLLAMGLSLLLALRRFAQPLVTELGELPGTRDYLDRARHPEARAVPGVLVMRPEEPLFFANADQTLHLVRQRIDQRDAQVVVLSLEVCDDLDGTSVEALAEFVDSLRGPAVPVLLARVKDRPRDALEHAGLLTNEQIALYWSVDDAVNAARRLTEPAAESSPGHH